MVQVAAVACFLDRLGHGVIDALGPHVALRLNGSVEHAGVVPGLQGGQRGRVATARKIE